jgi:hypothetical protein
MYTLTNESTTYVAYLNPNNNELSFITANEFNSFSFDSPITNNPEISKMNINVGEVQNDEVSKYIHTEKPFNH